MDPVVEEGIVVAVEAAVVACRGIVVAEEAVAEVESRRCHRTAHEK